jgi:hypothetical protein
VSDAHLALHRLWTWAVGLPGYDKAAWSELERHVSQLARITEENERQREAFEGWKAHHDQLKADYARLEQDFIEGGRDIARITEERDALLNMNREIGLSNADHILWNREARALTETLAGALRRLHAAFKDIGAHEGPSPELTDWRFTAAEDTEACYAMEAASAALSSVSAPQSVSPCNGVYGGLTPGGRTITVHCVGCRAAAPRRPEAAPGMDRA